MDQHYEMLSQYQPAQSDFELYDDPYNGHHVAVLAVFDHDWEQHLLVKQCSTGPVADFLGMNQWEYLLYYKCGNLVIHLHTFFDAESTPWVQAAEMVACWVKHGHYGGTMNAVESDSFD